MMRAREKIAPHLWYDKEAREAAALYTAAFADRRSRVRSATTIHDTPSGSTDIVTVELLGQEFTLLSAGPLFKFNPSVSFLVSCRSPEEVEALWGKLSQGGSALMELGSYPFSPKYGWLQDRYGLSWQLMYRVGEQAAQRITPMFLFVGPQCGKAEEAMRFYASVFRRSAMGDILRYSKGEEPDREGTVKLASFRLEGQDFTAMDSALPHDFAFNEAISFQVHCDTQEEIDYYWEKLTAVPEAEQCGWLEDSYGLSWQIVPTVMEEMLEDQDERKRARVTEAFLKMKKFDLQELQRVYQGRTK
jgi:predicted 3-demethylubiquinone-9 3-methyltransferase (glyoxalase superfamily)